MSAQHYGQTFRIHYFGKAGERDIIERSPLCERQFGFVKGKSAVGAVQEVVSTIKNAGHNKWKAIILLDVKNAYNTANWEGIIRNLKQRGVREPLLKIIYDYFRDRTLRICSGSVRQVNIGSSTGISNRSFSVEHPVRWRVTSGRTQGSKAHCVRRRFGRGSN